MNGYFEQELLSDIGMPGERGNCREYVKVNHSHVEFEIGRYFYVK